MAMKLSSPAFGNFDEIPVKFTCEGQNVNPPLHIDEIPQETKSMALIIDDPDSPSGIFTHWLVWDIPPTQDIPEGSVPGTEGGNDFDQTGYGGPCPASGEHRYFFRVFALSDTLKLAHGTSKRDVEDAIDRTVIDSAVLVGTYSPRKPRR